MTKTPKEMVLEKYPGAYCRMTDTRHIGGKRGFTVVSSAGEDLSGFQLSAEKAWQIANINTLHWKPKRVTP